MINGRAFQGVSLHVSDETVERIRQGYQCIECLELCETAYLCPNPHLGCPMAILGKRDPREAESRWKEKFGQTYAGFKRGSQLDWDEEADRLEERKERRAFARRAAESGLSVPGVGIRVPKLPWRE